MKVLVDSGVHVGILFNSQGVLTENDFVILTGDRGAQPTGIIVPIASVETAAYRGARLTDPLNAVTARLAMGESRDCDTRLDDVAALEDVARAWLGKNPGN